MATQDDELRRAEDRYFTALLADYAEARDDERQLGNQQTALFGAVIATLALFAAYVASTTKTPPDFPSNPLVTAALPLIPLAVVCLLQLIGSQATVRAFYTRAIEREIRARIGATGSDVGGWPGLPPMFYRELLDTLNTLSRGRRVPRFLSITIFLIVGGLFVGLVIFAAWRFDPFLKLAMASVYVPILAVVAHETIGATLHGRSYFQDVLREARHRARLPLTPDLRSRPSGERNLLSYLLIPRPFDIPKIAFFFIGVLLLVSLNDKMASRPHFWPQVFVLAFMAEMLIYQCRYQLNDLRGLGEDAASPVARERGRIRNADNRRDRRRIVGIVLVAMLVRLYLAVMLCALPFISFFHHFLPMLVGVFAIAVPYEYVRGSERNAARRLPDGRYETSVSKPIIAVVIAVVSLGYPLRTLLGLLLPGTGDGAIDLPLSWPTNWGWSEVMQVLRRVDLPVSWEVIALVVGYTSAVGIIVVTMTWCLEGGAFVRLYRYSRGEFCYGSEILLKPHLQTLLCQVDMNLVMISRSPMVPNISGKDICWLQYCRRSLSVWKIALVVSEMLGVLLFLELQRVPVARPSSAVLLGLVTLVAVLYAVFHTRLGRKWFTIAPLLAVGTFVVCSIGYWTIPGGHGHGLVDALLSILALLGPLGIYAFFEWQSHTTLKATWPIFTRNFWTNVSRGILRILLGDRTIQRLWR